MKHLFDKEKTDLDEKIQEEIDYANRGWYTPGTSYYP